jgi:phosphopantothenoylcysteine decarboxylase / phosphopantothenate---cysteine ligase
MDELNTPQTGKKILLGISGSIAAYKAALLCRLLIKAGYQVKVVMTEAACEFITPLTLSTLSGHEVMLDWKDGNTWSNHVEAGLWADLMVIAPATATTLSKMATGHADNILMATYLSAKCPVMVAPAMDLDMWVHPTTKNNINALRSFGNQIIPVGHGFLASGLSGDGRMAEPEEIVSDIDAFFDIQSDLKGKKILLTAGPTYEALDPVRFIGNHSSGKMGYAIARQCAERGAEVVLVSGPASIPIKHPKIKLIKVSSAQQMYDACAQHFSTSDVTILAAAVADYRPAVVADKKMKKSDDDLKIELVRTIDIAATLGTQKTKNQIMVGFALETNDEINHATQKLHKKNLDFIVLNSLSDPGAGFQHDTNKITILDKSGQVFPFDLKSKDAVAGDIIDYLVKKF